MNRRQIGISLTALLAASGAWSQDTAGRPLTVIIPYPPGGGTDAIIRTLAGKLGMALDRPVILENKGGAGSAIGMAALAKSNPDGNTVLVNGDTASILNLLIANLRFNVQKDFAPVAFFASSPLVLAGRPNLEAGNLRELIAAAKRSPGSVSLATPGKGTVQDLAGKMLMHQADVKLNEITYRGGGPALNDVLAGHADIGVFTSSTVLPYIATGKIKPLAVVGDKRSRQMPDLPHMGEAGVSGVDVAARYVMLAPAGTPSAIVQKLNAALSAAVNDPEAVAQLDKQGYEPFMLSPADAAARMQADYWRWGAMLKAANITPE
jgi:tripartite-type tricarboxylate transporter receptor subunit TctC